MTTARRSTSLGAAAMVAMALASGLPQLGQQTRLAERMNHQGERMRPPPPKRKRVPTPLDLERIAKAEAKRERKAAHTARCVANGCQRQTATRRNATASAAGANATRSAPAIDGPEA